MGDSREYPYPTSPASATQTLLTVPAVLGDARLEEVALRGRLGGGAPVALVLTHADELRRRLAADAPGAVGRLNDALARIDDELTSTTQAAPITSATAGAASAQPSAESHLFKTRIPEHAEHGEKRLSRACR